MHLRPMVFLAGIAALIVVTGAPACRTAEKPASGKLDVVTTFYPLLEGAARVGGEAALKVEGERASVQNLVPPGAEPHDFEPSPRDIATLSQADIVVYNGAGFEPWLQRVIPDLEKKPVVLVDASQSIQLLAMQDEEDPSATVPDPHFWLDPVLMQSVVTAIADAFAQADPGNRANYEANAAAYVVDLEALHQAYQSGLAGYQKRAFVTSHAAFSYLARRYNLEMIPVAGLSPEAEPSPQQLAAIVKTVRERGIRYIFFETLVSPRLAETIAQEAGAQTLVLNPLEGLTNEEIDAGKDYISVMEDNLANLKTALEASQ